MFKNGKVQILVVIALIVTTLMATIAAVNPSVPSKVGFPDYFQRHPGLSVPAGNSLDLAGDFYQRHPEWASNMQTIVLPVNGASEYSDYYQRHPELHSGMTETLDVLVDRAPLDECFDVSISELTACREASTLPPP